MGTSRETIDLPYLLNEANLISQYNTASRKRYLSNILSRLELRKSSPPKLQDKKETSLLDRMKKIRKFVPAPGSLLRISVISGWTFILAS